MLRVPAIGYTLGAIFGSATAPLVGTPSQLLFFICPQTPFAHGEDGIRGIPQGKMVGIFDPRASYRLIGVTYIHHAWGSGAAAAANDAGQIRAGMRERIDRAR